MAGLEANPADPESTVKPGDATVSVKTGDNSLVEIFAGLSMLSLAGLCLLRKKED